jgi:hypothetical protein
VVYEDVELPGRPEDVDEAAFARMQERWPVGHLAYVFGLSRKELLRLPQATPGRVLALDGSEQDCAKALEALLPGTAQVAHLVLPDAH